VVGGLAGPPVIRLLSGPGYALSGAEMGLLSAGACLYAGMLVAAQALIAAGRHRASTAAWGCGLAAAAGLFAAVPDLVLRAALAFTGGSAVALAAAAVLLLRGPRPAPQAPSAGGPALSGATPTGAA
jgi:O-antigen/teichoic acid export membrane protein